MSITGDEMNALILRYLRDKYPGTYDDMTEQKLKLQPYHKLVWTWWQALAYYRMDGHYERLEDAQDGHRYITIMGDKRVQYEFIDGKYVPFQSTAKEDCKAFYGDRIPGTY